MKKGNIYLQTTMQIKTKPLIFNTLQIFYLQNLQYYNNRDKNKI